MVSDPQIFISKSLERGNTSTHFHVKATTILKVRIRSIDKVISNYGSKCIYTCDVSKFRSRKISHAIYIDFKQYPLMGKRNIDIQINHFKSRCECPYNWAT